MRPIDMRKDISDMTWAFPEIRQATFGCFKFDMEIAKITTRDITIS